MANPRSAKILKKIFSIYEKASGQAINLQKSTITFGKLVKPAVKTKIRHILGIYNEGGGKYLGLPEEFQQKKSEVFQYILDRIKDKTQGWSKKFLSPGGKEILLKAVAMAMPVYCMNLFKLPKMFCAELDKLMAQYWWGKGEGVKGMHWLKWKRLCYPKKEGGLGFRDFEAFNNALLAKQVWRILNHPDSLMAQVLRSRYFAHTTILHAKIGKKASYIWSSILEGRNLIKQGIRFNVGVGSSIQAWTDPWLPETPPRPPFKLPAAPDNLTVRDLFHPSGCFWDEDKVRTYINPTDVNKVLGIKLSRTASHDYLGWHYNRTGIYTVKSGYWLATHRPEYNYPTPPPGSLDLKQKIWKLNTATKLKIFMWKLVTNILPTGGALSSRRIIRQPQCVSCCHLGEDREHIFFMCPYAQAVWKASAYPTHVLLDATKDFETKLGQLLQFLDTSGSNTLAHLPMWILWRLWKHRNTLLFQRRDITFEKTLQSARSDTVEWHQSGALTNFPLTKRHSDISNQPRHWVKPETGWIKCNYDAAWTNGFCTQTGWILRDSSGRFIVAGQGKTIQPTNALEGEMCALLMAMQFCWSRGLDRIVFEGDNARLLELLHYQTSDFGLTNWLSDVGEWRRRFTDIQFTWTPRYLNIPADLLSKLAIPYNSVYYCYNVIPNAIWSAYWHDIVE